MTTNANVALTHPRRSESVEKAIYKAMDQVAQAMAELASAIPADCPPAPECRGLYEQIERLAARVQQLEEAASVQRFNEAAEMEAKCGCISVGGLAVELGLYKAPSESPAKEVTQSFTEAADLECDALLGKQSPSPDPNAVITPAQLHDLTNTTAPARDWPPKPLMVRGYLGDKECADYFVMWGNWYLRDRWNNAFSPSKVKVDPALNDAETMAQYQERLAQGVADDGTVDLRP